MRPGTEPSPPDASAPGSGSAAPAGLSAAKVSGQALAAVTTAGIGAYLGGAVGTVSGAAIASVVTTIGDAFYQRSIERTRDSIKARLRRDPGASEAPGDQDGHDVSRSSVVAGAPEGNDPAHTSVVPGADPSARTSAAPNVGPGAATSHIAGPPAAHQRPPEPDESPTQVLRLDGPATRVAPSEEGTRTLGADHPTELAETPAPARSSSWRRYGVFAATGLLVFLIALVAITGIERVKGSPLAGGGPGTSVGSVLGHPTPVSASSSAPPSEEPSSAPATPSATTTSSSAEAPAPTTSSRAPQRQRTSSTTSERGGSGGSGGGGLLPNGLLPGN